MKLFRDNASEVRSRILSACLIGAIFCGNTTFAQEAHDETQSADGADTESSLANSDGEEEVKEEEKGGKFLILPIFITEPAIGEGLGGGVVYFHNKDNKDKRRVETATSMGDTSSKHKPPPTATGAFGFYTSNDTAGVGVGHANSFKDDKYRIVGALANMRINSEIFLQDIPFGFTLEGNLIYANGKRRMGESDIFLGLSLLAMDADIGFSIDPGNTPPIPLRMISIG